MFDTALFDARTYVEDKHEWRKWTSRIPFIDFPSELSVQVIPPFGGAIARFIVKHPDVKETISVYLDCYEELGIFGEPYWEMYPYGDGDIYRTPMDNVDDLVGHISEQFDNMKSK